MIRHALALLAILALAAPAAAQSMRTDDPAPAPVTEGEVPE